MKAYTIHYQMYEKDTLHEISFLAKNKQDAYNKAVYEIIPVMTGIRPCKAYVYSVTYQNGNYKIFC